MANMKSKKVAVVKKKLAADKKKLAADKKRFTADAKKVAADKKKVAADKKKVAADKKKLAADKEKNLARIEAERAVRAKFGTSFRRHAVYRSARAELAADKKLAADEKLAADKKKKNLARIEAERAVRAKFGTSFRRHAAYRSARAESRMPADSAMQPLESEWNFKTFGELRKYVINPAFPLGNRLELLKRLGTFQGGREIRALRSVGDYAGYPPNVLKRHALLLLDKIEKAKEFYGEDIMAKVKVYIAKDDTPEKLAILGVKG